ncbi:mas-related G-protein coupled receptor member H-like [Erythrolamprus reginae]|uniref:mas-related G-protein coupled receptor member H-like n=1 Tax=Erythrolamprus reginae TaxID=121349 RepID=UPI00396CD308
MMNSSFGDLDTAQDYDGYYNDYYNVSDSYENTEENSPSDLGLFIWQGIIFIPYCIGFVGNGYIIWLLGCQIKRNRFTTFILHLAIADFGYITSIFIIDIAFLAKIQDDDIFLHIWAFFYNLMYINSNFLLTAISIDRCVAVLFPIWHRCSRPKHLSSKVCVLLWISSFLLSGIWRIINIFGRDSEFNFHFFVTAIVCLPLITISTVILFITMRLKIKQRNQGRLLLMILITLLCFLILTFPLSVLTVIINFPGTNFVEKLKYPVIYSMLLACINSSINPVIYYLVGRRKRAQSKESVKVILQKVFNEGEATGER